MRHLTGLGLGLVLAAALYAAAGWGAGRIEALRAHGAGLATAPTLAAQAALNVCRTRFSCRRAAPAAPRRGMSRVFTAPGIGALAKT